MAPQHPPKRLPVSVGGLNPDACVLDVGRPPQIVAENLDTLAIHPLVIIITKAWIGRQQGRTAIKDFQGRFTVDVPEFLEPVVILEVPGAAIEALQTEDAVVRPVQTADLVHVAQQISNVLGRHGDQAVITVPVVEFITAGGAEDQVVMGWLFMGVSLPPHSQHVKRFWHRHGQGQWLNLPMRHRQPWQNCTADAAGHGECHTPRPAAGLHRLTL